MKNIFVFIVCCSALIVSCQNNKPSISSDVVPSKAPTPFGKIDSAWIYQYKLENKNGINVTILNYGGIITSINVPDKNGEMGDIVLGFDSLSGYLQQGNPYFGCLVGRYANRIANAKFKLNHLHGGLKGFDKVIWTVKDKTDTSLILSYNSKSGEEGYPGNLQIRVTYTLTALNELKIDYYAETDQSTPVNLTNHTYFNLSAGKDETILEHELQLDADQYTEVNKELLPTGKQIPVKATAMDFTKAKRIGLDIEKVKGGYDHNWVLNKTSETIAHIGYLYHPASGRMVDIFTTQPGIQFYSGNFLDGTLVGKKGQKYLQHGGLALETQHFPDSPNQPDFPNTILNKGEKYQHTTIYKFTVR